MKRLLLHFCALFCLGFTCYGQSTPGSTGAAKPAGGGKTAPAAVPPSKTPQVQTPAAGAAAPAQASPTAPGATETTPDTADPGLLKTPCGVDPPDEVPTGAGKPYVIGPLDVLQISVWNAPQLSTFYDVGADGLISMHLIGQIKAAGETKTSLAKTIRAKLGASVFECPPEVNVQVTKINSKRFFVYGEVGRPGEYPLVEDMTLMDAFANVGGFGPFANTKKIYILRGNGSTAKTIPFNYNEVKKGKRMEQNIKIENGDRIFVP